jgi:uncharacterized membrane protein
MASLTDRGESQRLAAVDIVRGLVIVLMTLDHSSSAFNGKRMLADGAAMFRPDHVFEPAQFITRWVTHLCAPTFVLLAGLSLALSVARRQRAGVHGSLVDRDILFRGGLLVVLDLVWMSWIWRLGMPVVQLGVLYAIGMSMIGMIVLRRLPAMVVGAIGAVILAAGELVIAQLAPTTQLVAAAMTGGQVGRVFWLYPFLPWTGFLLVGWAIGMRIAAGSGRTAESLGSMTRGESLAAMAGGGGAEPGRGLGMRARDWLALAGVAAVVFAVVRGLNGYGNAALYRRDGALNAAWIEWLHVSKYPPSLSYAALELAIAFALLGALWDVARPRLPAGTERSPAGRTRGRATGSSAARGPAEEDLPGGFAKRSLLAPLAPFGQTALFFYLLHVHILKGVAVALGVYQANGLWVVYLAWLVVLALLYPVCRWYLGVKRRHPDSVLRFV